ncbi:MAG: hypothetical protein ACSHXI_10985 [Hoeflea sp.]|uniref:hypothetical protein n=1 Tax=Hoeflea sp. TaxID=1940281 RepID=UPI003EF7BCA6
MLGLFIRVLVLSGFFVGIGSVAHAETTEWFSGKEQRTVQKRLRDKLLMRIECRDTNRVGLDVSEFEYRVTYTDNPEKIKVRWVVGNLYGPFREQSKRDGSKLISYDSFRRKKSGLKVHCAVWHKKK